MTRIVLVIHALLFLGACKKQHGSNAAPTTVAPDPKPPATASASTVASAEPPPTPPLASCAAFDAEIDAKLAKAVAALADAGLPEPWTPSKVRLARDAVGLGCVPFERGAWIVEPGDLDLSNGITVTTDVAIRAQVDGRMLGPWTPEPGGAHVGAAGSGITLARSLAGDYDGDGVPELWLRTDEDGVEGGHFANAWIVTAKNGVLARYAPSKKLGTDIGKPVDVDGDGRLDLPVTLGLSAADDAYCVGRSTGTPAKLLAHALPDGTFSSSDDVAVAFAKRQCGAKPARITSALDALCALLWTPAAELPKARAAVAARCVPWDCELEADHKPQKPGASFDCNDMLMTLDQDLGEATALRDRLSAPAPVRPSSP